MASLLIQKIVHRLVPISSLFDYYFGRCCCLNTSKIEKHIPKDLVLGYIVFYIFIFFEKLLFLRKKIVFPTTVKFIILYKCWLLECVGERTRGLITYSETRYVQLNDLFSSKQQHTVTNLSASLFSRR